jgi:hypothetical protein
MYDIGGNKYSEVNRDNEGESSEMADLESLIAEMQLSKNFKQLNVRAMQVLREEYTRQQMQRP